MLMAKGVPTSKKPCAVCRNRDELPPPLRGLMIASELVMCPDIHQEAPAKKGGLI
jgi:hypothetical protein